MEALSQRSVHLRAGQGLTMKEVAEDISLSRAKKQFAQYCEKNEVEEVYN